MLIDVLGIAYVRSWLAMAASNLIIFIFLIPSGILPMVPQVCIDFY